MKPILCVDFDGVVHSYETEWRGADVIPDPPVVGALKWLERATKFWTVCIYSSRSEHESGRAAMRDYLEARAKLAGMDPEFLERISYPTTKPAAMLTIDDRAITFQGDWSLLDPEKLLHFKPWNRRRAGAKLETTGLYGLWRTEDENGGTITMGMGWPTTSVSWSREAAVEFAREILKLAEEKR